MKTIILEGTSTTGKTTIKEKLVNELKTSKITSKVLEESRTLLPYLNNPDLNRSLEAMNGFLDELEEAKCEIAIVDRLYFTHVLINNSSIRQFSEIEKRLLPLNPLIVFLRVKEEKLGERIFAAIEHRDKAWEEHVHSKGTKEEVVDWYIGTQVNLFKLYNETALPKVMFDTTNHNYDEVVKKIIAELFHHPY